ncbi:MAG: response regulator [Anaerolineae bacterium]
MTWRVLVLERDQAFAARLTSLLSESRGAVVSVVSTVKEACLLLMEHPRDLAFVPITEGHKIVRTLRAVQPGLRLILLAPAADDEILEGFAGHVQGILLKPNLEVDLPSVMENALGLPVPVNGVGHNGGGTHASHPDTAVVIAALQQARLNRLIQTAVFAHGKKMLAHWGELNAYEAKTVALRVGDGWQNSSPKVRVRFLHLPAHAGDLLLYTQRVSGEYVLTLVARPETPLTELRVRADELATNLLEIISGKRVVGFTVESKSPEVTSEQKTYAVLWRPVKSLPAALQGPIRRAIERLADANACELRYLNVDADLIHLVVTCPPERGSTWAAYLFKNGSEATIQQEFKVPASLWETGFYATESAEPISGHELTLFLEHDMTGK